MNTYSYLKGVYNIMPTPFLPDGTLDVASLKTLTDFNIAQSVDGMTILGVMGEASKLSDAERDHVIAGVIEAADGRIPICVGTTHSGTDCCVMYSKRAQELGAKAVMVAPPKLARSNDAALRRHYLAVAQAIDIPIVVQDHPPSAGVLMSVEFIAKIGEEAPLCRWIKLEDEPTPTKIGQVLQLNPALQIFGGTGGLWFYEELRRGAIGIMTGFGYPEILVDIYRKFTCGDVEGAGELFYRYTPLIRFESQPGISLMIRKWIYAMRGAIAHDRAREPYARLDEGTLADLKDLLGRLGLL